MGFRRSERQAREARRWRAFLQTHGALLGRTGLPPFVYESRARLDHLLMHGYHPDDLSGVTVADLDGAQRAALVEAIVQYFRAGFDDPGLGVFPDDVRAAIRRRAGLERD